MLVLKTLEFKDRQGNWPFQLVASCDSNQVLPVGKKKHLKIHGVDQKIGCCQDIMFAMMEGKKEMLEYSHQVNCHANKSTQDFEALSSD